jgi:hypothetical protein
MSKFGCVCGHSMSDITDNLPYKASFLPDEDTNHALDNVMEEVASLIHARERGEQAEYLTEQALFLPNPTLRDILYHAFSHPTFEFGRTMYECERCGRIWMQAVPEKNEWVSYLPESARRGILRHQGAAPKDKNAADTRSG